MPQKLKIIHNSENNHLTLFKKELYSNDIRSAYEDLLCIGRISRVFQIT